VKRPKNATIESIRPKSYLENLITAAMTNPLSNTKIDIIRYTIGKLYLPLTAEY